MKLLEAMEEAIRSVGDPLAFDRSGLALESVVCFGEVSFLVILSGGVLIVVLSLGLSLWRKAINNNAY